MAPFKQFNKKPKYDFIRQTAEGVGIFKNRQTGACSYHKISKKNQSMRGLLYFFPSLRGF